MLITIILLTLISVAVIAYLQNRSDKNAFLGTLFNLLLVLFGFALATFYDDWKIQRVEKHAAANAVVLLRLETSRIHGAINGNIQRLEDNIEIKNQQLKKFEPLNYLPSSVWNSIKYKHTLFISNTGDLVQIENLYTLIDIVNRKIEFRENFIASNHGSESYKLKLAVIDTTLKHLLEKIQGINDIFQKFIWDEQPYEFKGYKFETAQGKVIKTE
jgi:hypothetical protein